MYPGEENKKRDKGDSGGLLDRKVVLTNPPKSLIKLLKLKI